jgi:hypothetical protein
MPKDYRMRVGNDAQAILAAGRQALLDIEAGMNNMSLPGLASHISDYNRDTSESYGISRLGSKDVVVHEGVLAELNPYNYAADRKFDTPGMCLHVQSLSLSFPF